jgi:hypothetical protein
MTKSFTSRLIRSARWRGWLAAYVLLSLVWPAIGPLPWLIDFGVDGDRASLVANAQESDAHHHHDASEIPGSPTHPDDHNCFQCDVIKHLARCVPSDGAYPIVAFIAARPPQPLAEVDSTQAASAVPIPPIRGPPSLNG